MQAADRLRYAQFPRLLDARRGLYEVRNEREFVPASAGLLNMRSCKRLDDRVQLRAIHAIARYLWGIHKGVEPDDASVCLMGWRALAGASIRRNLSMRSKL